MKLKVVIASVFMPDSNPNVARANLMKWINNNPKNHQSCIHSYTQLSRPATLLRSQ